MTLLTKATPPNLPVALDAYGRYEEESFRNVLRLYFRQLNDNVNNLSGTIGGRYLQFPYAAIQRTTDKSFTANTATQITFDQNDYLSGCENDGTDGITVDYDGIYNYQFSVQLKNADTQIHSAWIWLRKNGTDIAGTGSKFDVTSSHGGTPGFVIAACNFYVDLESGDTIEMWAAVSNTDVTFDAAGAATSPFAMPAIPSVVATLSFVSVPPQA
jgi:hypothetical protein